MSILIIEDGSLSTPSANSYIALTEADSFCSDMGYSGWATLATASRESAILRGMVYIDSLDYKGHKTYYTNPLSWPRIGVYGDVQHDFNYPEDYEYWGDLAQNEIPKALKRGVCQAAYEEAIAPGILLPTFSSNVRRERVDVIETEYFAPSGADNAAVFSKILALLGDILNASTGFAKVLRI